MAKKEDAKRISQQTHEQNYQRRKATSKPGVKSSSVAKKSAKISR